MSLPRSSVPKGCARLGGSRTCFTFIASGLYGATNGASTAIVKRIRTIIPPITASRFFLHLRQQIAGQGQNCTYGQYAPYHRIIPHHYRLIKELAHAGYAEYIFKYYASA